MFHRCRGRTITAEYKKIQMVHFLFKSWNSQKCKQTKTNLRAVLLLIGKKKKKKCMIEHKAAD